MIPLRGCGFEAAVFRHRPYPDGVGRNTVFASAHAVLAMSRRMGTAGSNATCTAALHGADGCRACTGQAPASRVFKTANENGSMHRAVFIFRHRNHWTPEAPW